METTKLEQRALEFLGLSDLSELKSRRKELQPKLDKLTGKILSGFPEIYLIEHSKQVYNDTIGEYLSNPHTRYVIDALFAFVDMVPENSPVLDIGCGHGRDVAFMRCGNKDFRQSLMKDPNKHIVPTKILDAVGVDISTSMVEAARARLGKAMPKLTRLDLISIIKHADMHHKKSLEIAFPDKRFGGIWSCTAFFTHTPDSYAHQAMKEMVGKLNTGGIMFMSYTNGGAAGSYDKLLISSTGRVKYFSQPKVEEVTEFAAEYGLKLISQSLDDFVVNGEVKKKDLFASQFFKKE